MSPATPGAKKRRPVSSGIRSYETPAPSKRVHSLGTAELTSSPSGMETSPSASSGSTPFSQRKNPGQIMEQINPELDISDAQSGQPVEILANFQIKKYNYKTMYQRLLDVSEGMFDGVEMSELNLFLKSSTNRLTHMLRKLRGIMGSRTMKSVIPHKLLK